LFHSSAVLSDLAATLKAEIKHEKSSYAPNEIVAKGPPAPFTLTTAPGDTNVSLKRDFKGEQISVDASVNLQDALATPFADESEEDEGEYETNDVQFNVTVTKAGTCLVFECISDGTYWDVRHVSLEPAGGLASEVSYSGPRYEELDTQLQDDFRIYLEERGISEDLGEYLRHLLFDKEQQEYMNWLEKVDNFLTAK
jgi:hypothetical protein